MLAADSAEGNPVAGRARKVAGPAAVAGKDEYGPVPRLVLRPGLVVYAGRAGAVHLDRRIQAPRYMRGSEVREDSNIRTH